MLNSASKISPQKVVFEIDVRNSSPNLCAYSAEAAKTTIGNNNNNNSGNIFKIAFGSKIKQASDQPPPPSPQQQQQQARGGSQASKASVKSAKVCI